MQAAGAADGLINFLAPRSNGCHYRLAVFRLPLKITKTNDRKLPILYGGLRALEETPVKTAHLSDHGGPAVLAPSSITLNQTSTLDPHEIDALADAQTSGLPDVACRVHHLAVNSLRSASGTAHLSVGAEPRTPSVVAFKPTEAPGLRLFSISSSGGEMTSRDATSKSSGSRRPAASEQTQRRKEIHGHRGALRRVLAALFHRHRGQSAGSGKPEWSLAVQPGTLHDPREAELVIEPVGQRIDKRVAQIPNTTIVGKGGNRYRLLNSLTPRQEKLLSSLLDGCEPEVEDFVNGRLKVVLGQGAFGSVRLALNEQTQQLVVVKKMLPEYGLEEVKKFKMLDELPEDTRSTIINMEDYAIVPGKSGQLKAYLFEELMNHGDLGDYENAAVLDLPSTALERLDLAVHILELVQNIHDHHTYHRDLKPDNLLRTTEGTIKLGDVGFMSQELYPSDVGGTLPFMPPEAGQPQARADLADAFAIGVMFYQLLGREHPAVDYPPPNAGGKPLAAGGQLMDNYHLAKDSRFVAACESARQQNSEGRASLSSVAHQLMHPDPAKRLTVGAAKGLITQLFVNEQAAASA